MQKYLAQVEAVAPHHLDKTRSLVKGFLSGSGPKLQQLLLERSKKMENWATDWWLQEMYLGVPLPLPVNSNPGISIQSKELKDQHESAVFLSRVIMELLDYQEMLDRCELPVERLKSKDGKGAPLCMAQHYQMFRVYRRPGLEVDELVFLNRATSGNHIIVAHHNQFYNVPVRKSDNCRITEAELTQQFLKIMEIKADPTTLPVGILTATQRPFWANAREELIQNDRNCRNLGLLEQCLVVVCIDDHELPSTYNNPFKPEDIWIGNRDYSNVCHHALHGGGSQHMGANRWFDKTVQLILDKGSLWAVCYEHSAGEAPAIVPVIENITEKVNKMPPPDKTSNVPMDLPAPEKLEWCLSEVMVNHIRKACAAVDSLVDDLDMCVLNFDEYTNAFIKSCNVSPDVYVQLALQLTYFRIHGKLVATYETAGIRRFALGRVDVIRSASPEALTWVKAMCQDNPCQSMNEQNNPQDEGTKRVQFTIYSEKKHERIKELFDLAVQRQVKEVTDNITGHGIDNHLMGLRLIAKEAGEPIPDIFLDEAYKIVNHFSLSTSQVTSRTHALTVYGPVVPDGYGCGYNFQKDKIMFGISAFRSDGQTNSHLFAETLAQALRDMATMLKNAKQKQR